ncbi:hypothetical protein BDV25DRAFT_153263 [Aspergillus avenaceus]|uniref:Uncharacterized protein n=1 Tax=Aspergillus avenaceus TaxID=36643 RepID=A0A5N6TXE0_ASPAV|nr:hypothetical protein BDV25DRAFT_153263 [Aspergillus avenaceus]
MARAETEIREIITSLMAILRKNTNPQGIPHRPLDRDLVAVKNYMSRLLILQGLSQQGINVPENPWDLFLSEFGPIKTLCQSVLVSSANDLCPPSILLRPGTSQQQSLRGCHVSFPVLPAASHSHGRGTAIPRSFT